MLQNNYNAYSKSVCSLGPLPWSWDGSVGTVSSYGLNDQGFDFGQRQALKRPDQIRESHIFPLNGYRGFSCGVGRGGDGRGVMLTTYLHPAPRFSMSGAMPLLPLRLQVAHRYNSAISLGPLLFETSFKHVMNVTWLNLYIMTCTRFGKFTWENRNRTIFSSHRDKSTRTKIKLAHYQLVQMPQRTQHKDRICMDEWHKIFCCSLTLNSSLKGSIEWWSREVFTSHVLFILV
jgi:hypothetical protein